MIQIVDKTIISWYIDVLKVGAGVRMIGYLYCLCVPTLYFSRLATTNATPKIDFIKIAAKAGAKAGASSGLMAATQSAARAGAEAGKMAGEQAGAMAGEAAAAAAAQSVFAKTFKTFFSSYKLGNLKLMVRLFGPRGEKIIRKYWNTTSIDNNSTELENNSLNHVINIHLYGNGGQNARIENNNNNNNNFPQGSSSTLANSYLPSSNNGISNNNKLKNSYGNSNTPSNQIQSQNPHGEFQNNGGVLGSSGQLMHNQQYVPIDTGSNPRQSGRAHKKSDDPLEISQNDEIQPPPQFTSIPSDSPTFTSLAPDPRSSVLSLETSDSSSPHFETIEQNDFISSPKSSLNILQNDNDEPASSPVFTTIVSEGTKNNSIHNPSIDAGRQSTRENEIFVYYPRHSEDPDEMARKLVYEGGPASKGKKH